MESVRNLTKVNTSTSKLKSKRRDLSSMISDKIHDDIYESAFDSSHTYTVFEFKSGWINVYMDENGDVEVLVSHYNEHQSPALEKAICACLPDWRGIEDEKEMDQREEQEFRDYLWRNCRY